MRVALALLCLSFAAIGGSIAASWFLRNRKIAETAWQLLRGHIRINDGVFVCTREHVEAGELRIKKAEFENLKLCVQELTFAKGFIVASEKKNGYDEAVEKIILDK